MIVTCSKVSARTRAASMPATPPPRTTACRPNPSPPWELIGALAILEPFTKLIKTGAELLEEVRGYRSVIRPFDHRLHECPTARSLRAQSMAIPGPVRCPSR
jgi:hypothetical protein